MVPMGLVHVMTHCMSIFSSVTTLVDNYVPNERAVKNMVGDLVLDIRPNVIKEVF